MIRMYTLVNEKIVNVKFYKNNTDITRKHYIDSLKRHYKADYKMLETINFYKDKFITRNIKPFDDNFFFEVEKHHMDGDLYSNTFFSYEFIINPRINLTLLFPDDSYTSRTIFANEVAFYLKNSDYIDLYERCLPYINEFKYVDNEYLFVEKQKLAMKNEDD